MPSFFFKPEGFAEYGYGNDSKMYYLKKRVIACDPNFEKAVVLPIQRGRAFRLFRRWIKLSMELNARYGQLEKAYQAAFPEMTSEPFWQKYLKL